MSEWTKDRHEAVKQRLAHTNFTALNIGDAADALAEIERLQAIVDDYENAAKGAMDERCDANERHCACVPALRAYITAKRRVGELQHQEILRLQAEVKQLKDGWANTTVCPTCLYLGKPGEVITTVDGKVCVVPCPDCNPEGKP